jgi:hypothetical protein
VYKAWEYIYKGFHDFFDERNTHKQGVSIFYPSSFMKVFYSIILILLVILLTFGLVYNWMHNAGSIQDLFLALFMIMCFVCRFVLDIYGRCLVIKHNKLIQRTFFYKTEIVDIDTILNCFVKTGVDPEEKRGAITLRIQYPKGFLDINTAYYSIHDLQALTQFIGFPDVLKKGNRK